MVVGDFLQGFLPKSSGHFFFKGFGEKPVNIMVAIIHKDKTSTLHVVFENLPLLLGKLHQLMPAEVAKWALINLLAAQLNHALFLIHRNRGVLHQAMQDIGRHALVRIPIAGGVFEAGEEEVSSFQWSVSVFSWQDFQAEHLTKELGSEAQFAVPVIRSQFCQAEHLANESWEVRSLVN